MASWKLTHSTRLKLQCNDDTHSILLGEKGVRLSEFDYFLAKQLIQSSDGIADSQHLSIAGRLSGFHPEDYELTNHLSHLGFVLTYGLGAKITVQRTPLQDGRLFAEDGIYSS